LKTANSGYLTAASSTWLRTWSLPKSIAEPRALEHGPLVEGGDVVEQLGERVLGRVLSEDILKPGTEEVLIAKGTLLDEKLVRQLEADGVDQMNVRSPISCQTRYGVCSTATGAISRASAISMRAVASSRRSPSGEPGTQLTMRTSTSVRRRRERLRRAASSA